METVSSVARGLAHVTCWTGYELYDACLLRPSVFSHHRRGKHLRIFFLSVTCVIIWWRKPRTMSEDLSCHRALRDTHTHTHTHTHTQNKGENWKVHTRVITCRDTKGVFSIILFVWSFYCFVNCLRLHNQCEMWCCACHYEYEGMCLVFGYFTMVLQVCWLHRIEL
jgi:hypothetical protein